MTNKKNHLKRNVFLALGIIAVALISYAGGSTYAKYVHEEKGHGIVVAKEFYFTSDYLKPEGANYTLNPGTKEITFQLRNYTDDLRWAEDKITFTVDVTDNDDEADAAVEISSPTLTGDKKNISTVTVKNLKANKSYTVTATGTAGYQETLSATFTVAQAEAKAYKYVEQTNEYVLLTVWTENVSGEVKLSSENTKSGTSIPVEGLIPDATDTALVGITNYIDSKYNAFYGISVGNLEAYSSHTYRFFKEDTTKNYTVDDFTVMVGSKKAVPGTP